MKQFTYDGRQIQLDAMSQQHLSNAYYYNLVRNSPIAVLDSYLKQLQQRFDNELLPYRPKVNFQQEINFLKKNNMIDQHNNIIFNGKIIGKIDDTLITSIKDFHK